MTRTQSVHRPYHLSVRAALVLMAIVVTLLLAMFACAVRKRQQHRTAILALEAVGAEFYYSQRPRKCAWAVALLGEDYSASPRCVCFGYRSTYTDADLVHLKAFEDLECLSVGAVGPDEYLSDGALRRISELTTLQELGIRGAGITDDDLRYLAQLTDLRSLACTSGAVRGQGLLHLASLRRLRHLVLWRCGIEEQHLVHLRLLPALEDLSLSETRIGDRGLGHLTSLARLRRLDLDGTKVRGEGLAHLAKLTLERLSLRDTPVDDAGVAHLSQMRSLQFLDVSGTLVSDKGLSELRSALPHTRVEQFYRGTRQE